MIRIILLSALVLVQSCTNTVVVEGPIPTPMAEKIPAKIGMHYANEFRYFRHKEDLENAGSWDIDVGGQNFAFFRNFFGSLFSAVVEVPEPPLSSTRVDGLDGIIVPKIEKFEFLTPTLSGLEFYSVSIEYRVALYDKDSQKIGEWKFVGYGKSEGGAFSRKEAVNQATVLAIRDAGAQIFFQFLKKPEVLDWMMPFSPMEPPEETESNDLEESKGN